MPKKTEIIIKPKSTFSLFNFSELWRYRELFYIFAWRDIKVRYKQTAIGVIWVIFQPLISMIVFTVLFGNLVSKSTYGLPYPVFVLTGLIFWTYFSNVMTYATNSFIENENIIKKVYFPKEILPISGAITASVDFAISLFLLACIFIYFHITPTLLTVILIPILFAITTLSALGIGFFLASVNVKYRDVRYALPFFMQLLFFLTPVVYSLNAISPTYQAFLYLNPLSGALDALRKSIVTSNLLPQPIIISLCISLILFFAGLFYFRKVEKFFSDII